MKVNIRYKIAGVFVILSLIFVSLFTIQQYYSLKDKKVKYIENELLKRVVKVNGLLLEYHSKVDNKSSIDPQAYLKIVRELSFIVKKYGISMVKTVVKKGDKFFISATNATDEEFISKSYAKYFDPYLQNSNTLLKIFDDKNMNEVYQNSQIFMPFEIKKHKYIAVVTISDEVLLLEKYEMFNTLFWTIILISALFIIGIFLFSASIEKQIKEIHSALVKLFNYVISSKERDRESVVYINNISQDDLGLMSGMINRNIKEILKEIEANRYNQSRDEKLIENLVETLEPSVNGVFEGRVGVDGHNPRLNELRDVVNRTIPSMDKILLSLNNSTKDYLNNNYTIQIDKDNYEDKTVELINGINTLGEKQSKFLVERVNNAIKLHINAEKVDDYIEDNGYMLDDISVSLGDVVTKLESDAAFSLELENALKSIKRENIYINELLDKFGSKYEQSLKLIIDLDNNRIKSVDEFTSRFSSVIKDSSVRDSSAQNELTAKFKEITSIGTVDKISEEKTDDLLELLISELLKDIKYSLFLFDENIDKIVKDSASKVSSFSSIRDASKVLKERVSQEFDKSSKIRKITTSFLHESNDLKYEIIEKNDFIGKDIITNKLMNKE